MRKHVLYLIFCLVAGAMLCLVGLLAFLRWGIYADDTEYTPRFTEDAFRRIRPGMTEAELVSLVGGPFDKYPESIAFVWEYSPAARGLFTRTVDAWTIRGEPAHIRKIGFNEDDQVAAVYERQEYEDAQHWIGATTAMVRERLGEPLLIESRRGSEIWRYSRQAPSDTHYLVRNVVVSASGIVQEKHSDFYFD